MRKRITCLLTLCLVVILLFSISACTSKPADTKNPSQSTLTEDTTANGASTGNSQAKEIELTVWQAAFRMPNEEAKPEKDWEINRMFKAFEESNPGVKIISQFSGDQNADQNRLKAAVLAGNAPDIINIYSGFMPTSLKDVLLDITSYVPEDDLKFITGWQSVRENLKEDGAILAYPAGGPEIGILLYNKSLVSAANVDLEGDAKPKTAAEFVEALKKIKATGVLPIVAKDSGYNSVWMFPLGAWWTQYDGSERVTSNSLGVTKFADDGAFIKTLSFAAQMYKDGLINKDYVSIADPSVVFYNRKAAMMATGNWGIQDCIDQLGEDTGVYTVPSFDTDVRYLDAAIGGVGQAIAVVNTCENPDVAVKLLSFLNSKENVLKFSKLTGKIPQRTDITAEELGWKDNEVFEKTLNMANSGKLFGWNDNAMQTDVMNEYYVQTGLAVIGKVSAEDCAKALDKKAAEVKK